jgi:hypothetical protein
VIHRQIDQLVAKINLAIKEEIDKGNFRPWKPENEHNPCYWKEYGTIALSDEVAFHTIEDICSLFDADYRKTKRGFLRKGGIRSPNKPELFVWWPSEKPRSGWLNSFDEVAGTITETHSDEGKKRDHYNWHAQEVHTRIVFFHYKDILGRTTYRYVGVFVNDRERSTAEIGTVWTRVGEEFNLGTGEYH